MTMPINVLLDTNALWDKSLRQRLVSACRAGRVRVYLPALVLVERERQLIQRDYKYATQNPSAVIGWSVRIFRQWVEQLATNLALGQADYQPILAFDVLQAQVVSTNWGDWLKTQSEEALLIELRSEEAIQALRQRFKGKRKTLADLDWTLHKADWSIAAVARQTGWPIVTNDNDPPFQQAEITRLSVEEFIDHLDAI